MYALNFKPEMVKNWKAKIESSLAYFGVSCPVNILTMGGNYLKKMSSGITS